MAEASKQHTQTQPAHQQPAPAQTGGAALAKAPGQTLVGTFRDPREITMRLQSAAQRYHLVSPATSVGMLPEGCSIAITTVTVDPDVEAYDVGFGNLGLAKSALDKIAAAAGISWSPAMSGRLDDGSDPHYCSWRAVGSYKKFDGGEVLLIGSKEMDLREGSPQLHALHQRAKKKNKTADDQIREMRLHIMAHAETKARLRAIRALGLRSSYKREEFAKPFVVCALMWTGQTDDVELRRAFALRTQEAMLGGRRALYGDELNQVPLLPAASRHAPPPVGTVLPDYDEVFDAPAPTPVPAPKAPPAAARKPAPAAPAAPQREPGDEGPTFRFGRLKDQPLSEGEDKDVEWYLGAVQNSVDDPKKAKFRAENIAHLNEIRAELARRRGEVPEGQEPVLGEHEQLELGEEEFPT